MQQNKNETLYMHTCTLFMCISCEYVTENQIFKSLSLILVIHFYFAKYEINTKCPQLTDIDKTLLV